MAPLNHHGFNSQRTSICRVISFARLYTNKSVQSEAEAKKKKTSATLVLSPAGLVSLVHHVNSRHKEKLTVRNRRAVWIESLQGFYISIMRDELRLSHVRGSISGGFIQRGWMPVPSAGLAQSLRFHVGCQSLQFTMFLSPPGIWQKPTLYTDWWNEKRIGQRFLWYVQDHRGR